MAPALLYDIGRHVPGLGCERVSLKRGQFHNELTRFRYQAVLRRDMPPPLPAVADAVEWAADRPACRPSAPCWRRGRRRWCCAASPMPGWGGKPRCWKP
ncbi:hypothetical protein ACFQU7_36455 [Pseudoroseomonas wenyumeiae]